MAGFIPTGVIAGNFPCLTTDPLNQFLYVGSWDSANELPAGEVQIYSIDPASGNLSALAGSPFAFNPGGGCIDFEPTGKFGYATVGVNSTTLLLTYLRNSITGGLTLLDSENLGGVPFREAIDPLGQYLYVDIFTNNFGSAAALGFSIDATSGALTPVPGASFALSNASGTFTFYPSGNFLFMANTNGASIDTYSVSRATGALTPTSTIATCINPTPLRFSPDGTFAYSTCSENSAHAVAPTVESFSVGATGVLTHLSSQPVPQLASDITVHPSGAFLYISTTTAFVFESALGANGQAGPIVTIGAQANPSQNTVVIGGATPVRYTPLTAYITSSGDNTLSTYSVNSDGTLTALQTSPPMPTAASPFSLSLWPWGTDLVFASGASSANNSVVPLSSAGVASPTQTLTTFGRPGGAVMDPAGQFAFEINSTDHTIHAYASGGGNWLATGQDTPTSIGTGPVVMDPAGFLVFVANAGSGSVSVYENFGLSTELQVTSGSPFSVCTQPLFMAVDPFKPLLYVACSDQTLRVMKVDYFNFGALTQAASVQLGGPPTGLTTAPNGNFVYASESSGVNAFSVNATTGTLTSVPVNPAISLANINGVYAEPSGKFLYVTTGSQTIPGAVFGFTVNSDGTLVSISAQPLATPKLPTSMTFLNSIH
jgi:6-phosphogluconolactonase (cycloisomerase 2 family)